MKSATFFQLQPLFFIWNMKYYTPNIGYRINNCYALTEQRITMKELCWGISKAVAEEVAETY